MRRHLILLFFCLVWGSQADDILSQLKRKDLTGDAANLPSPTTITPAPEQLSSPSAAFQEDDIAPDSYHHIDSSTQPALYYSSSLAPSSAPQDEENQKLLIHQDILSQTENEAEASVTQSLDNVPHPLQSSTPAEPLPLVEEILLIKTQSVNTETSSPSPETRSSNAELSSPPIKHQVADPETPSRMAESPPPGVDTPSRVAVSPPTISEAAPRVTESLPIDVEETAPPIVERQSVGAEQPKQILESKYFDAESASSFMNTQIAEPPAVQVRDPQASSSETPQWTLNDTSFAIDPHPEEAAAFQAAPIETSFSVPAPNLSASEASQPMPETEPLENSPPMNSDLSVEKNVPPPDAKRASAVPHQPVPRVAILPATPDSPVSDDDDSSRPIQKNPESGELHTQRAQINVPVTSISSHGHIDASFPQQEETNKILRMAANELALSHDGEISRSNPNMHPIQEENKWGNSTRRLVGNSNDWETDSTSSILELVAEFIQWKGSPGRTIYYHPLTEQVKTAIWTAPIWAQLRAMELRQYSLAAAEFSFAWDVVLRFLTDNLPWIVCACLACQLWVISRRTQCMGERIVAAMKHQREEHEKHSRNIMKYVEAHVKAAETERLERQSEDRRISLSAPPHTQAENADRAPSPITGSNNWEPNLSSAAPNPDLYAVIHELRLELETLRSQLYADMIVLKSGVEATFVSQQEALVRAATMQETFLKFYTSFTTFMVVLTQECEEVLAVNETFQQVLESEGIKMSQSLGSKEFNRFLSIIDTERAGFGLLKSSSALFEEGRPVDAIRNFLEYMMAGDYEDQASTYGRSPVLPSEEATSPDGLETETGRGDTTQMPPAHEVEPSNQTQNFYV